jgi:tetratricopeptide (TPR) repeat protein
VVKTLFIDVVLGVAVETRSSPMTFGTVVCVVMLMALLALRGFHRTLLNRPQTSWALTVGVFFGSYMLLHATWLALDPHYLWPLMPFVLLFIATGIPGTVKSPWVRRGVFVLLLTACFLYVREAAYAVRQSARRPQINRAPHQTLQWIRHQLTGEAFILAPPAPMISLYTGRHATALVPASDAEEYRYRLLQSSITHVFVQPWPMLHVDAAARRTPHWVWGQTPRWISFSPRGFEKIFSQEAENTELFALRPGGKFREAYTFYLQGMSAVEQGKTDAAFEAFLTASRTDPTMVSALNAYGATSLMTGHHLENGKTQLSRAVRLQPGSAIAWLNLARIHRRLGHSDQARFAYARAREILMKQGEPQALLSAVLSEQNTL